MRNLWKSIKWAGLAAFCIVCIGALILAYSFFRPNRSEVDPGLVMRLTAAVTDGRHNSNTDLIHWKGAFYLIHASSPWHFASDATKLVLRRSADAGAWENVHEFTNPGEDIRDPHFAVIGGRLFVYALRNRDFQAEPYDTVVTSSADGKNWDAMRPVGQDGWLFWRPETRDGVTWYAPAYWHEHGKSVLFASTNGFDWKPAARIYEGDLNDETAICFLHDGRMMATARLEVGGYYFGDDAGNTLIATSVPPYSEWKQRHSTVTRLDGPCLFTYNGRVYAVGRYQPGNRGGAWQTGSILARKRTSLFLVGEDGLARLSDLPSAGDTSYAGAVLRGDTLYVSYYTSDTKRDYPWVLGMLSSSDIMMAVIDMKSLEALALRASVR